MSELARAWGLRERGEWPRGRTPHERRAHVQVEAQQMAKYERGAWVIERRGVRWRGNEAWGHGGEVEARGGAHLS
jgi:hypothetical protein